MKPHRCPWRAAILAAAILTALTLEFPLGAKPVPKLIDKLSTIRCDFRDKQFDDSAFEFSGKNAEESIRKETIAVYSNMGCASSAKGHFCLLKAPP